MPNSRPECSLQCLSPHRVWQLLMSLCDMSYSLSTHKCENILYTETANDLTALSLWRKKSQPLETPTAFLSNVINTGCV